MLSVGVQEIESNTPVLGGGTAMAVYNASAQNSG